MSSSTTIKRPKTLQIGASPSDSSFFAGLENGGEEITAEDWLPTDDMWSVRGTGPTDLASKDPFPFLPKLGTPQDFEIIRPQKSQAREPKMEEVTEVTPLGGTKVTGKNHPALAAPVPSIEEIVAAVKSAAAEEIRRIMFTTMVVVGLVTFVMVGSFWWHLNGGFGGTKANAATPVCPVAIPPMSPPTKSEKIFTPEPPALLVCPTPARNHRRPKPAVSAAVNLGEIISPIHLSSPSHDAGASDLDTDTGIAVDGGTVDAGPNDQKPAD